MNAINAAVGDRQPYPALYLVEMQIMQPLGKRDLAPCFRKPITGGPYPCQISRPQTRYDLGIRVALNRRSG